MGCTTQFFPWQQVSTCLSVFMYSCRVCYSIILIVIFGASNVNRLREFVKHVYEDRRFTGDRTSDKPPRGKVVRFYPPGFTFLRKYLTFQYKFNFKLSAIAFALELIKFVSQFLLSLFSCVVCCSGWQRRFLWKQESWGISGRI